MDVRLSLLVLIVCIGLSQAIPRCLLSRLDQVECLYRNPDLDRASMDNEYSIHYTRMKPGGAGGVQCRVRPKDQQIRTITTSGTENTKIIYSPGFILNKKYDDQLLCQYNIDCGDNQLAFFNVTTIDLQPKEDCVTDDGRLRCQDYIDIRRGAAGATELCGNSTSNDSVLELQSENFTVFFRSSEKDKFTGFEMYVICFKEADRDREGCLTRMDFNSSVCAGFSAGSSSQDENPSERKRRDTYADITYSDIFPKLYPRRLRMRRDVADFHSVWRRKKRQAGEELIERIVLFNESVNYTDNTIRIADTDGTETGKYEGVRVLQTFNALGEVDTYFSSVTGPRGQIFPHFIGPGPLTIVGRSAYFQLFIIDPRGLVPDAEEEQELIQLNQPLLNAIGPEDDIALNDTDPPFDDFTDLGIFRRKRDISEIPAGKDSRERVRRQSPEEQDFTDERLFLALRNREACNPVLRQQALSLIQLFLNNDTIRMRVMELQNFTISCTVEGKMLNCTADDDFAPALDKGNYCIVNNGNPEECDPFYGVFEAQEDIKTVTVRAINCVGQRATQMFPK